MAEGTDCIVITQQHKTLILVSPFPYQRSSREFLNIGTSRTRATRRRALYVRLEPSPAMDNTWTDQRRYNFVVTFPTRGYQVDASAKVRLSRPSSCTSVLPRRVWMCFGSIILFAAARDADVCKPEERSDRILRQSRTPLARLLHPHRGRRHVRARVAHFKSTATTPPASALPTPG